MQIKFSLYCDVPEDCDTVSALEIWATNLGTRLRTIREGFGADLREWGFTDGKDNLDDVVLELELKED